MNPIAEHPSRSASEIDPVTAWSFSVASEFEEFSFRIVGISEAKVAAPASSMPSGAA